MKSEIKLPKAYALAAPKGSEISTAIAAQCLPGKLGEFLVRDGCNQLAVTRFAAKLAVKLCELKQNEDSIASVFRVLSIANASALAQALGKCTILTDGWTDAEFEAAGGKWTEPVKDAKGAVTSPAKRREMLVNNYWEAMGGKATASPTAGALSLL